VVNSKGRTDELKIGLFFLIVIGGGFVGVEVIGIKGDQQRYLELFKFWLTLIQVAGIGGITTLLLEWYKESVAKRKRIDEQRRQIFLDARKAYDTLKRTRRLLQDDLKAKHPNIQELAASLNNNQTATSLARGGRVLFDPQLSLESLHEQAKHSSELPKATILANYFHTMETFANDVSDALRASPALTSDQLKLVCDFLDVEQFHKQLSEPYHQAIKILLEEA
jgi:hypothetical protein